MTAFAVAIALALSPQDSHPTLPLTITQMWVEPHQGFPEGEGILRVEVLNTGQRTILAWGVRFRVGRPDGAVAGNGFALDSASVLPENRTGSVAPGRTTHNSGGGMGAPVDSVMSDGVVTFVIFDDDTALGQEREIADHFERRRQWQEFWQKMQAILTEATSHEKDPVAALSRIRQGMEAESDPKFREGAWYGEILARITPRRMEPAGMTPEQVLEDLRTTISAQRANADAHAVRR